MNDFEIRPILGPEVFIGLIGPLGTDLKAAREEMRGALARVGYKAEIIRLSSVPEDLPHYRDDIKTGSEDERIETLMRACDLLRKGAGSGAILAHFAVARVHALRGKRARTRTAYIFDSLKHPEEIKTLRRVYGKNFIAFAFYEPKVQRVSNLERRIEKSHDGASGKWKERAEELIARDERDVVDSLGQNVRDTFPQADFFARADQAERHLSADVARGINTLFGEPFASPSVDEAMMFHARAAALRSADLSRQVGAVIGTRERGQIATGCNEVPRPGGGTYWAGDHPDRRDYALGRDPNSVLKRQMLEEAFGALKSHGWLSEAQSGDAAELADQALQSGVLKGLRVDSLIEFGRVVHAEMNALSEAALTGRSVRGASLYCTTFPCHGCARHIIGTGISRVVFIEPYPKSLVGDLYPHAVAVEGCGGDDGAVRFDPFVGVAPHRFMEWFHRTKRKDRAGYKTEWVQKEAEPVFDSYYEGYLEIEESMCNNLQRFMSKLGEPLTEEDEANNA